MSLVIFYVDLEQSFASMEGDIQSREDSAEPQPGSVLQNDTHSIRSCLQFYSSNGPSSKATFE